MRYYSSMTDKSKVIKFREEFGLAVRIRRHKLDLSQEDFADKASIHRTYVSSIELGKVDVGMGTAYKVAAALGLPLNTLIKKAERNI